MASLTEEQRLRIEENRKKALAIRSARQSTGPSSCSTVSSSASFHGPALSNVNSISAAKSTATIHTSNSSYPIHGTCLLSNQTPTTIPRNSSFHTTGNSVSTSSSVTKTHALPVTISNFNSSKSNYSKFKNYKHSNQKSENSVTSFYGNSSSSSVTVSFSLISNTRFTVEFSFNDVIINVLKQISGKIYDPHTSRWHFPLSSYSVCKSELKNVKELNVIVKPLPNYIVKVFIQNPQINSDYKSINLSKIHHTLLSSLYPFQIEGVQFGIFKKGRCIIADDMGLGKTIQALGISHYYYDDWPLLIVCPSSMRYQWEEEIRNNLPDIPVTRIFVLTKSKEQLHNPLVLITSYDLMAKSEAVLKELKFGVIIMDESHSMKNPKTNRTKSALALIGQAKRCILLSGTPALSRPHELYPQIKAIDPTAFSWKEFGLRYCDGKETRFGWDYTGSSNMDELKILLEERFMIRRLKSNVLNQLPSKIRQVVILDKDSVKAETKAMNEFARKLNDENMKGLEKRGTLLSYFAETAKLKIKAIKNYICELLETGTKFLVFAHHKTVLDEISNLLEEKETFYIRIDGSTSSDERKSVCDQFQYESKFRVAVLSITAASTGITLTAANLVVFAELFWNPGILTQAEDRVHRIGQQDSVLVQYLLAAGTADDHLWVLVKSKLDILNQAGLSKDNFSCERTSVISNQKKMEDYFEELQDCDADLSQLLDEVEESESKRFKLTEC